MKIGIRHFGAMHWLGVFMIASLPVTLLIVLFGEPPRAWPFVLGMNGVAALAALFLIDWSDGTGRSAHRDGRDGERRDDREA